ncbi:hypothetical protein GCK72_022361 [Caenorhabditis remanei]|uniref:NTF2-like domain-containing protein n=1 Tax=Caenorhabditis remanei TaxID=31234 RepID=A0A6A5FTM6_CAERE|nr:hypothetical protein GCK72_022361 [Caenorhabditis remanei]KAF1745914.1 hypothetical protein GCK72_022361 [Caenorhabditis remanei]
MWSAKPIVFILTLFGGLCYVLADDGDLEKVVNLFLTKLTTAYKEQADNLPDFFEDSFTARGCTKTVQKAEFINAILDNRNADPDFLDAIFNAQVVSVEYDGIRYRIYSGITKGSTDFMLNTTTNQLSFAETVRC